jgi:hypothetical protein
VRDESAENEPAHGPEEGMGRILQSKIWLEYVGANASRTMRAIAEQPDYFTYSYPVGNDDHNLDHVPAYAKLQIEALYPGIDAELSAFTSENRRVLKYQFALAPHADPAQIRLRWHGSTPSLDARGNLHLAAVLGEIIDYAPTAWYADAPDTKIETHFELQGDLVTFALAPYDASRAIVIDPWTVNPALPAPFNRAFEVDADAAGNVYAFGGGMGYNLKKYNAAGTLQWTHVSPWDTSNAWFGELLTLSTGDVFITSGSAAKIRRLTTAGAVTFTNNGPFLNLDEYWTLVLNCNATKIVSGGTRIVSLTSPQGFVFDMNPANGNQNAGSPYNVSPTGMKEIRALALGGNGNFYMLSNDNLIALNQSFGTIYSIASGTSHPYYSPAYMAKNVQGQNIIDANTTHIYNATGTAVTRRDIATGAILNNAAIPGGAFSGGFLGSGASNGGLVLDNCGNVYVGSTNQVLKYDAALAQLATVATTGAVYDVHVAPGGVVLWGGNALLTSNTSFAACIPKTVSCVVLGAEVGYFKAECHDDIAHLQWQSLQEQSLAAYVVERTQDGQSWETRANVAGSGTRNSPTDYEFREIAPLPQADRPWYYRLKMVDDDGHESYSGIAMIEACAQSDPTVMVVPTMAHDAAELSFVAPSSGGGRLKITNAIGQQVRSVAAEWNVGKSQLALPINGLAMGIYHVQLTDHAGKIIVRNARFVKE